MGGRVVALGTPSEPAAEAGGGKHVTFVPSAPFDDSVLSDLPLTMVAIFAIGLLVAAVANGAQAA